MITTLKSLQDKFVNDPIFGNQFVIDASWLSDQFQSYIDLGTEVDKQSLADRRQVIEGMGSNLLSLYYRALKKFLDDGNRRYPLYVRVPFSEDTFKINTESRIITVPKDFQSNGVGVVGDHLAEFLWFEVDRFYDVTDLMNCDITINWRNTASSGSLQATTYEVQPYAKYCDNEKVYFGWYISNNASLIAGTIEFAVHFFTDMEVPNTQGTTTNETVFSLYTQPAKITIKSGLAPATGRIIDDNYDTIVRSRPIFSEIVNSLDAAEPILTTSIVRGNYDVDPETGYQIFTIVAVSPDNAGLDLDGAEEPGDENEGNEVPAESNAANDGRRARIEVSWYWNNRLIDTLRTPITQAIDDGTLHMADGIEPDIEITDTVDGQVYTSVLKTNVPGTYRAYVGNRIIDEDSENYNGVRYVQTSTAILEEANQIYLADSKLLPAVFYIGDQTTSGPMVLDFDVDFSEGSKPNGVIKYSWFKKSKTGEISQIGDWDTITEEEHNVAIVPTLDERGYMYAEVRNIKNSMMTFAKTPEVLVMEPPKEVLDSDIGLSFDASTKTLHVSISNGYIDNEYAYKVYIIDSNDPSHITTTQWNLTGDAVYHIGPQRDFDLNELKKSNGDPLIDIEHGKSYMIQVHVSQVTCRNNREYTRWVYDGNNIKFGKNDIIIKKTT